MLSQVLPTTEFRTSPDLIAGARQAIEELRARYSESSELRRFVGFASNLTESYVPYVQVPVQPSEYVLIRHGVDLLEQGRRKHSAVCDFNTIEFLVFFVSGRASFAVRPPLVAFDAPPWKATESVHVRTIVPDGLEIVRGYRGSPEEAFDGTEILRGSTHDSSSAYAYIGKDEGRRVLEECAEIERDSHDATLRYLQAAEHARKDEASFRDIANLVGHFKEMFKRGRIAKDAKEPSLRVRARLARGIGAIVALLWVVWAVGLYATLSQQLDASNLIELLSALLIVILALVVYAVEKPFLRWLVYAQSASATTALLELPILHYLALIGWLPIPRW